MTKRSHGATLQQDKASEAVASRMFGIHEVEQLQTLYPDYQIELREGKIIVMCPSDIVSGEIGMRFGRLLGSWVDTHHLGRVLDASAGFRLPNGDLLSPDVSFVSRELLKQAPRSYSSVVPQLIVEIKSSHDSLRPLKEKIALFLQQGVQVGVLIDPDTHTVYLYRSSERKKPAVGKLTPAVITLHDGDTLTIPDLFPGLDFPITSLWPSVYE